MPVRFEVVAIAEKYTDKTGKEKNRYQRIGSIITTKNGSDMLKIENIPVGWDGWAYINEPREKPKAQPYADDQDIPF